MPSAQVFQAFLDRMARQSFKMPPASRAFRHVYDTAGQPPPDFTFFISSGPSRKARWQKARLWWAVPHRLRLGGWE
jgi:hypothetical protein